MLRSICGFRIHDEPLEMMMRRMNQRMETRCVFTSIPSFTSIWLKVSAQGIGSICNLEGV